MEPVVNTLRTPHALIEVLDAHGRVHARQRLSAPGATCTIGRSVACDIVLDDSYAAAEHTALTLLDDGRVEVRDLGSRNGTRLDGRRIESSAAITDAQLIVGRTRVRIRTALTELAPERVFRRDLLQRHRTQLALLGVALCLGFVLLQTWISGPEPLAPRLALMSTSALAIIGLWVAFWALITRVGHGAWTLRTHTAIAANTLALCLWTAWLLDVAAFSFQWPWLELVTAFVVTLAALGAIYLHLRKATNLTLRAAAAAAVAIPLLLASATFWFTEQSERGDVNRVALSTTVYPPQLRTAVGVELDDYLAHTRTLKLEANRKRQLSLAERPLAPAE